MRIYTTMLALTSLLIASTALAAPGKTDAVLDRKLRANDAQAVHATLVRARSMKNAVVASRSVAQRLSEGMPPKLALVAIDTLAKLNKPAVSTAVLREYAHHRRATIRARAIRALGTMKVRGARTLLTAALDDNEQAVRVAAAHSLADTRVRGALPTLFALVDTGDVAILPAIARLVTPNHVPKLMERLSTSAVGDAAPVLVSLLDRRDFPMTAKYTLVKSIRYSGRADCHLLLGAIKKQLPAKHRPLRLRIAKAMIAVQKEAQDVEYASSARVADAR